MKPMINRRVVILVCVFLLGIHQLGAQVGEWESQLRDNPKNVDLLLNLGRYYHNVGGPQEDRRAVRTAEDYLARLLEIEPQNAPGLVYYGSVLTMRARDALFPWDKLKFVRRGMARMDKAVFFDPDDAEVRFIRGAVSTSLPDMFSRLPLALVDFSHIETRLSDDASALPEGLLAPFYYNYGLALMKDGQNGAAEGKMQKAIHADPESRYAGYARRDLRLLKVNSHEEEDL